MRHKILLHGIKSRIRDGWICACEFPNGIPLDVTFGNPQPSKRKECNNGIKFERKINT